MYVLLLITLAIAGYGIYRRVSIWRRGLPIQRLDRPAERIRNVVRHGLAQSRTARDSYAGVFHRFIFYGFIVLAIATTVVALQSDVGISIMHGWFYLYFQSFIVDVAGVLVLVGIVMAAARRFLARPKKLLYTGEGSWILIALFVIVVTGFLLQGWRIAVTKDPWASWSPFGNLTAHVLSTWMSLGAMQRAHRFTWWFHMLVCFGFLAWIPYTKMMHVLTAPLNIYAANLDPIGASLKNMDFESTATFGVNSLKAFTWKDLLDLDACTECGRCTSVCPAHISGKELSPCDLILGLRDLMHTRTREAFALSATSGNGGSSVSGGAGGQPASAENRGLAIIGAVAATSSERLWQCTTCAACVEACPVFVEQMPKIVDMRRFLVMEEADFPKSMQEAITSLESRGHPFRGTQAGRLDWCEGLNVAQISDCEHTEVLLWVGCSGALNESNQKVARATAQLLQRAGVKFAILGREEKCCGDPARRIGNEFLFEQLAKENVATFTKHNVQRVVTFCPHCFNTLKHEYRRHGATFQVSHHSEYLAGLVNEGRLKPERISSSKVAFHDPCYLGRHNGVFDAPRQVLRMSSGAAPIEMQRTRAESFCCGGGGGMSFVEEPSGKRVNQERAREALDTGADTLAVGCPFCLTMMEDGVNACKGDRDLQVMDISELLWLSVRSQEEEDVADQGDNKSALVER
jgi:Fe-S oxidoreductase/nitrate reductase gamma subunit